MDVAQLRAGDIGLVRAPRGALGYPAHWLGQRYEHVFVVAEYMHVEIEWRPHEQRIGYETLQFVIEAGWTGVTLATLGPRLSFCDFVRPRNDPEPQYDPMIRGRVIQNALDAACRHENYSYKNLLRLAWQRLILRRKPPELAAAAVICTQGVAQWWRDAGFDPVPGIADWAILPDDFWNSAAVERLQFNEGRWGA